MSTSTSTTTRTTLFKMDASSRIREWTCWIENHANKSFVFIRHGLSGHQQTIETIEFPNPLASSPLARSPQAHEAASLEEYTRRIVKQRDRRGYTTIIPTSRPLKPMLAQIYQHNKHHVPPRCFIQPKLNGLRCLSSDSWMMSRTGTNFYSMPHIQAALSFLPPEVILDGEIYFHGWNLQKIMSHAHRNDPQPESLVLQYHIYDIIDESLEFTDRHAYLRELFPSLQAGYNSFFPDTPIFHMTSPPNTHYVQLPLVLVDTLDISSSDIDKHQQHFLSQGYEGSIIRNPFTPYEINIRSLGLLKYKPRQQATCKILDIVPSRRNHHQGVLQLYSPKHTIFHCSAKGNDSFRRYILTHRSDFVGRLCEVEFEDYSDDNKPIQPVCVLIHQPASSTTSTQKSSNAQKT